MIDWFANASIRRKLTIVTALTTTLAVLLAAGALGTYEVVTFRRTISQKLTALADVVGRNCTAALAFKDRAVANDVLAALEAEPGVQEGAIYDRDGGLFAQYTAPEKKAAAPPHATIAARTRFEKGRLIVVRPIVLDGESIGAVYIWSSLDELTNRIVTFIIGMLAIVAGCTFLALFISARLQQRITKPILDLARLARLVTSDRNFSVRAAGAGRDEVGRLVEDFNRMLVEIEQQDQQLRQHQEQLAVQVERRTQELVVANRQLLSSVRRIESNAEQIAQLTRVAKLLQSCNEPADVFEVVKDGMRKLFPDESGALILLDPSRTIMEVTASWGHVPPGRTTFAPEDCWAFRRGTPHLVSDVHAPLRCAHLTDADSPVALCVPITAQSGSLGVLQFKFGTADAGDPDEVDGDIRSTRGRLAVTLAEHIALALANLRLREKLHNQSLADPLTGLFNRRYLEDQLDRECLRSLRSQQPLSVVMIDVDDFKGINDTWGHDAGDAVLQQLSALLRSHFRGSDVVCRYGGDEFVVLLMDSSAEMALARVEELRLAVHALSVRSRQHTIGAITLSAGLASLPVHGDSRSALIAAADGALYQAKRGGRDRIVYAAVPEPSAELGPHDEPVIAPS